MVQECGMRKYEGSVIGLGWRDGRSKAARENENGLKMKCRSLRTTYEVDVVYRVRVPGFREVRRLRILGLAHDIGN